MSSCNRNVLIIAPEKDAHACVIAQEIEKIGGRAYFLDMGKFGWNTLFTYSINNLDNVEHEFKISDRAPFPWNDFFSVWYRRPADPRIPASVLDSNHRMFAMKEWSEAFSSFISLLDSPFFVNSLSAQYNAKKPKQLQVARSVGLAIPDTLITNDIEKVKLFLDKHKKRVVHKAISPPLLGFIETRRWQDHDFAHLSELALAPVIFQEEILGDIELRITIVGNAVFAAEFPAFEHNGAVDSRLNLDIPYKPHRLPKKFEQLLLIFMRNMGLVFGTVDIKINEKGEYVFLEVNPQGQFLYVEILTGMQISYEVAKLLTQGLA